MSRAMARAIRWRVVSRNVAARPSRVATNVATGRRDLSRVKLAQLSTDLTRRGQRR
jgi:hypothetical protein